MWKTNIFYCICCIIGPIYGLATMGVESSKIAFMHEPIVTVTHRGDPVMLNCEVEGNLRSEISWRKDQIDLKVTENSNMQLLSNGSLLISSVTHRRNGASDAGVYQCLAKVSNIGSILSVQGKLTIAGAPKFREHPKDLQVYEKEVARFACSIQGPPSVRIEWFWNGRPLLLDSRMTLLPSGALEIHSVTLEDQGEYYCSASNFDRKKLSRKAALKVQESFALRDVSAPYFIASPKSGTSRVGKNITFDCAANGYPAPSIVWLKDGATIDTQNLDSRFVFVGATRSLSVSDIRLEDAGVFMCRAENMLDSVDVVAELKVEDLPKFTEKPEDIVAQEKEDVEFVCKANGQPQPTLSWFRNGNPVMGSEYIVLDEGSRLRILGTVASDYGLFQCFASNQAGQAQTSARLTILEAGFVETVPKAGAPSAPRHLLPELSSNRFVSLSWHEPELNNEKIVGYSVFYRQDGSNRERVQNVSASSSLNDLDIYRTQLSELNPDSSYSVRVVAHTLDGLVGEASPEVTFTTAPDLDLPESPIKLRAIPTSSRSILVQWEPPSATKTNVSGYILYHMEVGSAEERDLELKETSYELTNLNEFTQYSFWVVGVNTNGAGDPSQEVMATTFSASPSAPPLNVTVEPVSSKSLIVRWEPPPLPDQNGIITGYKIRFKVRGNSRAITKTTDGNHRLFPLTDLERNTDYVVKLSAMTVNGSGPSTTWVQSQTFTSDLDENRVPGKPESIRAIPFKNSIELHWKPPQLQDVVIQGYRIGWGIGIPNAMMTEIESSKRTFTIRDLKPNSVYVLTLSAFNNAGSGSPIYDQVRTLLKKKRPAATLMPPVGLKAEILTPFAISLQWTDSTLNRNQFIGDSGYYNVRYTTYASATSTSPRYKYENFSDVTALIDNLKPATMYEFSVKAVKGHRESPWSLVVMATTAEARPQSPPRDVTVVTNVNNPEAAIFNWQPPKLANGKISGYLLFYTADLKSDWVKEETHGDKMSLNLRPLTPSTVYYYKMQAKNVKGFGPFSSLSNFTTPDAAFGRVNEPPVEKNSKNGLVLVVGAIVGTTSLILIFVVLFVLCRRSNFRRSSLPDGTRTLTKEKVEVKPPDLWIHHDQLELKNLNKHQHSPVRESAANNHLELEDKNTPFASSSTLDRRTPYQSSYLRDLQSDDETDRLLNRRSFKPKPLISVSPNNSVIGGSTSSSVYSDGTMGRVGYSLPQYPMPGCQGYVSPQENPYATNVASGLSSADESGTLGRRHAGNPLRSFSVPAPPQSAPTTPQQPKHIAAIRPQGSKSPFKKPPLTLPPASAADPGMAGCGRRVLPMHREDSFSEQEELNENLLHGFSTEELTQEMANLEDLMKDLSAIQANQFNC